MLNSLNKISIQTIQKDYPNLNFEVGQSFYWSPQKQTVYYVQDSLEEVVETWSLLHEVGHALLEHKNFESDFDLLLMELQAWIKAKEIASKYDLMIDQDHIEDCLDTYRDWLYQRSTCPNCSNCSQQINSRTYRCFNCNNEWHVSASRKCRIYRKNKVKSK